MTGSVKALAEAYAYAECLPLERLACINVHFTIPSSPGRAPHSSLQDHQFARGMASLPPAFLLLVMATFSRCIAVVRYA